MVIWVFKISRENFLKNNFKWTVVFNWKLLRKLRTSMKSFEAYVPFWNKIKIQGVIQNFHIRTYLQSKVDMCVGHKRCQSGGPASCDVTTRSAGRLHLLTLTKREEKALLWSFYETAIKKSSVVSQYFFFLFFFQTCLFKTSQFVIRRWPSFIPKTQNPN